MDALILINIICSAALCGAVAWVIVTPRIHEGPLIKVGLILLSVGLFGVAVQLPGLTPAVEPELRPLINALTILHAGVTVATLGVVLRVRSDPAARKTLARITGWGNLDDQRPADPLA
jgi:hypothetical protein